MDGFHKTFWHPQVPILVLIYADCSPIIQVSISLQNEAMFFQVRVLNQNVYCTEYLL